MAACLPPEAFCYFPCEVPDPDALTCEVLAAIAPQAPKWQLLRELNRLAVSEEVLWRPLSTLSGGERTKVLLAAQFLRPEAFLLIDEPTNHLDMAGRALLGRYLAGKGGFVLVSHDRAFLDGCIDHVLALNKTGAEVQRGNFSSWYANACRQNEFERAQNEKLGKEIARLQRAGARTANWSDQVEKTKLGTRNSGLRPDRGYIGHKAAKMMKRAKTIEERRQKAVEEKSALLKDQEHAPALKLAESAGPARPIRLAAVAPRYNGRAVCVPVSFAVGPGERVALAGANGSGKSTVLKLLCGAGVEYSGELTVPAGLKISYVPQDASFLSGSLRAFAAQSGIDETRLKTILRKLDFSRAQLDKDMAAFSAGQKKKVILAKSLCEEAQLLVWDEPLNYIDVFSRMQIEGLLLNSALTLLFVEHDRAFCDKIATKTVTLQQAP